MPIRPIPPLHSRPGVSTPSQPGQAREDIAAEGHQRLHDANLKATEAATSVHYHNSAHYPSSAAPDSQTPTETSSKRKEVATEVEQRPQLHLPEGERGCEGGKEYCRADLSGTGEEASEGGEGRGGVNCCRVGEEGWGDGEGEEMGR